jgi:hypothetical protein
MTLYAKDLMIRNFDKIRRDATIEEAIFKISTVLLGKPDTKRPA